MKRNPTTRSAATRAALTLAEVLVAMGILAVGLLGVASVFPVGGFYMQSGDLADRGNAIAQAALSDAMIRGHLDPENWVVHDVNTQALPGSTNFDASNFVEMVTGEYRLQPNAAAPVLRRIGLRDAIQQASVTGPFAAGPATGFSYRSGVFGDAFVIDPIGMAGALAEKRDDDLLTDATTVLLSPARHFPGFVGPIQYQSNSWLPWADPSINPSVNWPVRRATVKSVHPTGELNFDPSNPGGNDRGMYWLQRPIANELFSTSDDLAQFFPPSGDEPVRQRWETWSNGTNGFASVRQSRGDYSWVLSVAPASSEARDSLAYAPDAYPVEVSAAVFFKRAQTRGLQSTADVERLVRARVVRVTPGGGELLLTKRPAPSSFGAANPPVEPDTSPFEDLKVGQYVMVVGPHPQSFVGDATTASRPRLALRWCRVLSIEDRGSPTLADGNAYPLNENQVLVAFRGPQWPWNPARAGSNLDFLDTTLLSNDLRVAILPGVVAVHTKTMRLESGSAWSID